MASLVPRPPARTPSNFYRRVWLPAAAKAGLPGIHFHDLRHAGKTLTADAGASLRELIDRMGHSSTCAALIYQQPATRCLEGTLAGVAGGRLESLYMVISCVDRGWAWLDIAGGLSPLAPFLAPRSSCLR